MERPTASAAIAIAIAIARARACAQAAWLRQDQSGQGATFRKGLAPRGPGEDGAHCTRIGHFAGANSFLSGKDLGELICK